MGKKRKKQRHLKEDVIVIDLDDDEKSSEHLEADKGRLQQKSKNDKKKRVAADPDTNEPVDEGNDCIDLTEQDTEHKDNENSSEDVVLIEDNDSELDKRRRKSLPAYALMRQGIGFAEENLRSDARPGWNGRKASKQQKRNRNFEDERKSRSYKDEDKEVRLSPKRQARKNPKETLERHRRSPDRYTEKDKTSQNHYEIRHSPRKKNRDINYRENSSRDVYGQEENTHLDHEPRKRNTGRDRNDWYNDGQNDRSRSPMRGRKVRDDRHEYNDERNCSETKRTHIYFEKGQRRWEKGPVNKHSSRNSPSPDRKTKENGNTGRGVDRTTGVGSSLNVNVDGASDASKPISAVAVSVKPDVFLVLPHPSSFILKGKARVQPIVGSVCIMGHHLKDPSKVYEVYSPECISLVAMETVAGETNKDSVMATVSNHTSNTEETEKFRTKIDQFQNLVVLKVSRLDSTLCEYVTTLTEYQNLFSMRDSRGGVNTLLSPLGVSVFESTLQPYVKVTSELKQAIDDWTETLNKASKVPACMMVVGGKDSGKSTTNRLLINSSLNRIRLWVLDRIWSLRITSNTHNICFYGKIGKVITSVKGIYFLECDVGQTEFTPPGCISLHYITKPILGPPFTHQRRALCCYFFGGVTPQDDPSIYIDCVQRCVQYYQQLSEPGPLIINTMGWVKGLGLQLLIDTIRMVSPSHVVQLWCRQKHHNCDHIDDQFHLRTSWTDLTKENSCWGEMEECTELQFTRRQHKLMIIDSISKSGDLNGLTVRLRPVDFRNLSLLSHLYSNLDQHSTLTSAAPYMVPWRSVAIHVCYMPVPREQIFYAINASVVALCHCDLEQAERPTEDSPMFFKSMPLCKWIGYGIVRGVNPVKKEIYLVTSVGLSALKEVNTLLKGSVTLPEQLLMKQHCHGDRLYVDDAVQSLGLATVKPRRHMPRARTDMNVF